MIVLTEPASKALYREIEKNIFEKTAPDPMNVIRKKFARMERYAHEWLIGEERLKDLFKLGGPGGVCCISTIADSDPVFILNLAGDTKYTYEAIMFRMGDIGITTSDPETGLYLTHERIFMYDPAISWCLFADRANDTVIVAHE